MQITYLADHLHLVPQLAQCHFDEWHHLTPWENLEQCNERLRHQAQRSGVPTTLIALKDGQLLGSASLVIHDMKGREDLTPWLGGVFVAPNHRRQGIGTQLVQGIVTEAGKQNIARIYLYTTGENNENFYAQMGWTVTERVEYLGKTRVIMHMDSI